MICCLQETHITIKGTCRLQQKGQDHKHHAEGELNSCIYTR